jgi:hypothetical protein
MKATERFLNDLRKDVGDNHFDRLFAIHRIQTLIQAESNAVSNGQGFRFFTPVLLINVKKVIFSLRV